MVWKTKRGSTGTFRAQRILPYTKLLNGLISLLVRPRHSSVYSVLSLGLRSTGNAPRGRSSNAPQTNRFNRDDSVKSTETRLLLFALYTNEKPGLPGNHTSVENSKTRLFDIDCCRPIDTQRLPYCYHLHSCRIPRLKRNNIYSTGVLPVYEISAVNPMPLLTSLPVVGGSNLPIRA